MADSYAPNGDFAGYSRFSTQFIVNSLAMLFVLYGIAGFTTPKLFGIYLTGPRCVFFIVVGMALLGITHKASLATSRICSAAMALLFGGLAGAGFAWGTPGARHIGITLSDSRLWTLFDGALELGRTDHIIHAVLAFLFLLAVIAPRSRNTPA